MKRIVDGVLRDSPVILSEKQKLALKQVLKRHTDNLHRDRDFFPTEEYHVLMELLTLLESEE